jgi:hypothetical protein
LVAEGAVLANMVVVVPPRLTFMPSFGQAQEPVCVEALGPDPAVERFREGIVGWFTRPAEVHHNIMLVGPKVEILRDDLGTLIDPDALWPPMRAEDVTDTLDLALTASGCDSARILHKPRLLSDNIPCWEAAAAKSQQV